MEMDTIIKAIGRSKTSAYYSRSGSLSARRFAFATQRDLHSLAYTGYTAAHRIPMHPSGLKHITSRDNPSFKELAKLANSSRERRKRGLTVLDGVHLIEAYSQRFGVPQALFVAEGKAQGEEIRGLLERLQPIAPTLLSDGLFKEVSRVETPTGVVAVVATPAVTEAPAQLDFCLLLEDIQDPGNLGSILRSAAAAGIEHVFVSAGSVFAWSPRVLRAAMGAHFVLNIHEGANLAARAAKFHGKVIASVLRGDASLFEADLTGPLVLLVGNEGSGLSPELLATATHRVTIPMPGRIESLNAAAAAAICLFERVRQVAQTAS
jgi:RNA methyltransferase, TrmH family